MTNLPNGLESFIAQQDISYFRQIYEQVFFYKKKTFFFISVVGPGDSVPSYSLYERLKVGIFQTTFGEIYCFYQHTQPPYDIMQNETEKPEFVQGKNFAFINSLKNKGTKYLLCFDDWSADICNSKEFVNIPTAGRHRCFSTIYIKHYLFHQSKLGRDVEQQSTHICLFKSPQGKHQVGTLSVQFAFGSTLVNWYRKATSVPFDLLLIVFSPRTENHIRYCTNNRHTSKFHVPENEAFDTFGRWKR